MLGVLLLLRPSFLNRSHDFFGVLFLQYGHPAKVLFVLISRNQFNLSGQIIQFKDWKLVSVHSLWRYISFEGLIWKSSVVSIHKIMPEPTKVLCLT